MQLSDIKKVAVLGAGQMGAGIAQVCAAAGIDVALCDIKTEISEKSIAKIGSILQRQVDKEKMRAGDREKLLGHITPAETMVGIKDADLIIEAITENPDIKFKVFSDVSAAAKPGAILASNTSSISISKLAAITEHPEHVIGMHFMNPVPLMKLVEIIVGLQTSDVVKAVITALAEKLGKTVIHSKDSPGFLINRFLIPMLNEACFVLQEGVGTAKDIDTGAKLGLNHPMGPLELADHIGLDTCLYIGDVLYREFADSKYRPPVLLRQLVAAGWNGRKAGRGFYEYDEKGRMK